MDKAKMTFRFDDEQQRRRDMKESALYAAPAAEAKPEMLPAVGEPAMPMSGGQPRSHEEPPPGGGITYRPVEIADDWNDPFSDYTGTGGAILPSYTTRKSRTSWWKVAGSLTGAIVTGALFGFVVLSMFSGNVSVPIPGITVPDRSSAGQSAEIPVFGQIGGELGEEDDKGMPVTIAMPGQTYHFLQYGVFSTAEGVELAQQELEASGIAAARDTVDEKRVYAGVSSDREQAKLLSGQLKTAGVHLILHEIALPSSAELVYNGDVTVLERYFARSAELIDWLGTLSASRLVEVKPQLLTAEEQSELGERHQRWTESAAAVREQQPEAFAQDVGNLEKAMNSAVEAMAEYQKTGAKTLLWEVQDQIMGFILGEQKMLGSQD
ncbi:MULTISPECIES: SPOR domain-containing protein [Paenibacillus]|uniref:SPOR domain-containing protein n=1 Tax=Paenibacillus TaxID=44249 RepID=UPI002FE26616